MSDSPHLGMTYLEAAQAQKHVTVNEALRRLDGIVQLSVLDRDLTEPPGSPAPGDGDRYLVADSASGDWAGKDGRIAAWQDGAWAYFVPQEGWICWVADEAALLIYADGEWGAFADQSGYIAKGQTTIVSEAPAGAQNRMVVAEELLSGLSGSFVETTIEIPDRAVVFGVSTRTVTDVTGAASYDCGVSGEANKFGGSLGAAAGSTNAGVIGPTAYYANTKVRLTANGSDFTGGAVRVALHYFLPRVPQE